MDAVNFVAGCSYEDFAKNRMMRNCGIGDDVILASQMPQSLNLSIPQSKPLVRSSR